MPSRQTARALTCRLVFKRTRILDPLGTGFLRDRYGGVFCVVDRIRIWVGLNFFIARRVGVAGKIKPVHDIDRDCVRVGGRRF